MPMIYGKRGAWILGACALGVLLSFVQVSATAREADALAADDFEA